MIDIEKLKEHPLTISIAKLEASIMGLRDNQIELMKIIAKDLNCDEELLIKMMHLTSKEKENINE